MCLLKSPGEALSNMKRLLSALRWDFIRQLRYNIIGIMLVVSALYIGLFHFIPLENKIPLLIFLIFNDPTALGMIFIGSLILFEKGDGTLEALVVTPLQHWEYILSKAISLTTIATGASLLMALFSHGIATNVIYLILGVALTSMVFVFLGIIVVAGCRSFNQYLLRLLLYLIPLSLPLLNYLGVTDTLWWYVFPTQATLLLLEASFSTIETWKIVYSILCLLIWNALTFYFALKVFAKDIAR